MTMETLEQNKKDFFDKPQQLNPAQMDTNTPLSEADSVYNKSAEISPTGNSAPVTNNIGGSTTNVNNSSSSTVMKNEVKNLELTVNRLFSERQKFC